MSEPHIEAWDRCLKTIKENINQQSFKTWFEPIKPLSLIDNVLTIQVPSQFFYEWLEEHYVDLLKRTIKTEISPNAKLEYSITVDGGAVGQEPQTVSMPQQQGKQQQGLEVSMPSNIGSNIKNPFVIPGLKQVNIDSQLNPNMTMETFIEGECNRLARSAGLAAAQKPGGTSFNPLMIYGEVGLGKTHLIQAIGNEVQSNYTDKTVLYVSSEKFTNQFIEAIKDNTVNQFLNFYQLVDVLIIDDVQFFSKKEKTQEIFFHIFNQLHQKGRQLILSSDRAPRDIEYMEERLLSRFKWGLTADLTEPDYETRLAILEQKMHNDGVELPQEVIEYMAYNIKSSIRELEGAMISILAHASFSKREVGLSLAKEIVNNFTSKGTRELTIEQIHEVVCDQFQVDPEQVRSKTRKREVVQARQLTMFLAKHCTNSSLKQIGKYFNGRDHSTVIYANQTVQNLMDTDPQFREQVEAIQKRMKIELGTDQQPGFDRPKAEQSNQKSRSA
jgi:chromosomal replication initiator protein